MTMADSIGDEPAPDEIRAAIERMIAQRRVQPLAAARRLPALRGRSRAARQGRSHQGLHHRCRGAAPRHQVRSAARSDRAGGGDAAAPRDRTLLRRSRARPIRSSSICRAAPMCRPSGGARSRAVWRRRAGASWAAIGRWSLLCCSDRAGTRPSWRRSPIVAVAAVVLQLVAAIGRRRRSAIATRDIEASAPRCRPGNGMPTVQIEPLRVIGSPSPGGVAAERLRCQDQRRLCALRHHQRARRALVAQLRKRSPADPRADYRLSGAVEYIGDSANAWFTLTSSCGRQGRLVAHLRARAAAPAPAASPKKPIVISLTNSLLQSYGVIRARDRANQLASNAGDPRYRCILEAADAIRTSDRQTHEQRPRLSGAL